MQSDFYCAQENVQGKPSTTKLPPPEFTYGVSKPRDKEGAREGK